MARIVGKIMPFVPVIEMVIQFFNQEALVHILESIPGASSRLRRLPERQRGIQR